MKKRNSGKLAVVTGASSGIGYELAKCCAEDGYDLIVAADSDKLDQATQDFRALGANVESLQVDLADITGVDRLLALIGTRDVDALLANAGHGLGKGFLDQNFHEVRHVVDTNVTGTIYLIHEVGRAMRDRKQGKILITGSIAGFMPGTYQAVYNASKAFMDSFSFALRAELKGSGVTVTCLMPGATETDFFERADLMDTALGQQSKDDPAEVARQGYAAMLAGKGDVVTGWMNKLRSAIANVIPNELLAEAHRSMTEPGSGKKG